MIFCIVFMGDFMIFIERFSNFLWDKTGVLLILGCGVFITIVIRGFQIRRFPHWIRLTAGRLKKGARQNDSGSISQFQALCTTLAATVGVGNIAGVSSAVYFGGPGAVFWMWVAAIFGMALSFAENSLGVFYRKRDKNGAFVGGAMYYLRDGLGEIKHLRTVGSILATVFSFFSVLAAFGMGNASQINTIVQNTCELFNPPQSNKTFSFVLGILLSIAAGCVILGGLKRIAKITEKTIPAMVIIFILGTGVIIFYNVDRILPALLSIFRHAFGIRPMLGGTAAAAIRKAVSWGLKRGVFSNEAGLGSTVTVNASANVTEPAVQGMWGMFGVFIDTAVMCTLTALCVLCSGLVDLESGKILCVSAETTLVSAAFSTVFGYAGAIFVTISLILFAFSTVIGWSQLGAVAWEYLFGEGTATIFRVLFVAAIIPAALADYSLSWGIADIANALMMVPNLFGVIILSPKVFAITQNYKDRVFRGKSVKLLLRAD